MELCVDSIVATSRGCSRDGASNEFVCDAINQICSFVLFQRKKKRKVVKNLDCTKADWTGRIFATTPNLQNSTRKHLPNDSITSTVQYKRGSYFLQNILFGGYIIIVICIYQSIHKRSNHTKYHTKDLRSTDYISIHIYDIFIPQQRHPFNILYIVWYSYNHSHG